MIKEQPRDTTEPVICALIAERFYVPGRMNHLVQTAIAAHNEDLERQGYVTVKPLKVTKDDVMTLLLRAARATYPVAELVGDLRSWGLPIEVIDE